MPFAKRSINLLLWVIMSINSKNKPSTLTQSGLFNRKQIADYIGVSERTISNMMRKRLIPVLKIGKTVRFDPPKVKAALEKYEIEAV
jgi:excisionase family DNA binding protein